MLKELFFRIKVKKLDEIHIRQYLERQGFEFIYLDTERGKQLLEKLEIEEIEGDSFVYDSGRFKYVFLGECKNDDDKLMTLLHECGHIEYNHKSRSKYNEAKAWSFAYNLNVIHTKVLKLVLLLVLSVALTFFITKANYASQNKQLPEPAPKENFNTQIMPETNTKEQNFSIENEEQTADSVYVTKSGTKYHRAGCHYIENKTVTEYTKSEAQKDYAPCKVCRP